LGARRSDDFSKSCKSWKGPFSSNSENSTGGSVKTAKTGIFWPFFRPKNWEAWRYEYWIFWKFFLEVRHWKMRLSPVGDQPIIQLKRWLNCPITDSTFLPCRLSASLSKYTVVNKELQKYVVCLHCVTHVRMYVLCWIPSNMLLILMNVRATFVWSYFI